MQENVKIAADAPRIKPWSEQTITNRFMFFKIFSSYPDACKKLLKVLLGFKIARIEYPLGEKDFEADIDSHAIRVDVYTEDENHVYDLEMQTEFEGDLSKRARYYQALMDIDKLKSGEPYEKLKDSIVVFICTFDPFRHISEKKAKYVFQNLDVENIMNELNDRTTKIFFNVQEYAKITDDEELKRLLKYFSSSKTESEFTSSLDKLVKIARHNSEWRQTYMTRGRFEYYAEKHGYEKGVSIGIDKGIAKQKAEDEKQIQQQAAEIARLKAQLAKLQNSSSL